MYQDTEFIILIKLKKLLSQNPKAKQREIARICEFSLGSTNSVLRSFEKRGWIIINRITSRRTTYKMTDKGIEAINGYITALVLS